MADALIRRWAHEDTEAEGEEAVKMEAEIGVKHCEGSLAITRVRKEAWDNSQIPQKESTPQHSDFGLVVSIMFDNYFLLFENTYFVVLWDGGLRKLINT